MYTIQKEKNFFLIKKREKNVETALSSGRSR